MEAFLIDEWLGSEERAIPVLDEASVSLARERAREVAAAAGLDAVLGARLATIASELAHNQLAHARHGQISVRPITRGELRGVEIIAADEGAGLADPARALEGKGGPASGGLGFGLAAVREHAQELDIDVRLHEGTCIRARVFASEPAARREVGVYARPYPGEARSGDHAAFHRAGERLLVTVCDGLGHGEPARAASSAAMRVFAAHREGSPREILEACHRELGPTRGAVMAVVEVSEGDPAGLQLASVGNITIELVQPRASRRFGASSFVVGSSQRGWRPHAEASKLDAHETLLLYSDGIMSRASVAEDLALLREHPVVIAQRLVERFGRDTDDVLVLVAK